MHYTGYFLYGKQFDLLDNRGEPFAFTLCAEKAIHYYLPRLVQSFTDMCIGEQRKLTIPSDLVYSDYGLGDIIPGGATLMFDVECLEIIDTIEF